MRAFFSGDLCIKSTITNEFISKDLKDKIEECEIVYTNLEGPCLRERDILPIKKAGPAISQNKDNVRILKKIGFNLFGLANNHIMDYGKKGLEDTLSVLKDCGASYIGAGLSEEEAYSVYRYVKDCRVSVIAVAEKQFGCINDSTCGFAWMNDSRVEEIIRSEKKISDYVIVTCHCGAELFDKPLPEVRFLYKNFIDFGADAVIGHHPHICQGIEEYKGRPIFYSLGNFAFEDFGDYPLDVAYIGAVVVIDIDSAKKMTYEILPVAYNSEGITLCDEEKFIRWITGKSIELKEQQKYLNEINNYCIKIYDNVYEDYILKGCGLYFHSFKSSLSTLVKLMLKRRDKDYLLQWHNFAVETNRWIIERALSLKHN
ncbi:MAG: CapA family protein [Butyrivibrio sp.]|nr:CapA family protein [Butyrivibrio sp.]